VGAFRSPRQLRSAREIAAMREAGLIVYHALKSMEQAIRPGVTTAELDGLAAKTFQDAGAEPLFLNFPNATPGWPVFPAVTCISINEEVVHGIPAVHRKLAAGDVASVDTGCKLNGWCGDSAVTFAVGDVDSEKAKLLSVTKGALLLAIDLMGKKSRWSEVASEMERFVKDHGFSVVEDFVGHGIGREMHEDPQVPNFVSKRAMRSQDFKLEPGLVIAVEPMVNVGVKSVKTMPDGWTQSTRDGKPSAHFEHTIAVTENGPQVLTAGPNGEL
jgi:methionyl aminopeptidase